MEEQIKLLMQMNQMLAAQNERQAALLEQQAKQLESQSKQIQALTARIDELLQRIDELSHKKNSRNSSVPPSSDGYSKPAPKSQRKSTGAKPGGQTGHKGSSMKLMKEPDEVREHYPDMCAGCPNRGSCHSRIAERRYETDIVVESRLVEHRQMVCCCPMCNNKEITGAFPDNITGTKQYGHNLKAFATALSTVGMVSIDRIHQLLSSVFQVSVSTGAIQNWIKQLSDSTKDAVEKIREYVSKLKVINCDETGLRVQSSLKWMHCICNEKLSYFGLHDKRGHTAMMELGILPEYHNIMIHDFWKSYFRFENATHGICCAHLQRELVYADEQMKQSWAKPLHDLLSEILHRRKELEAQGGTAFSEEEWNGFSVRYDTLIRQGFCEYPIPEKVKGKRGRPGKGKIVCLLERFRDYKEDILRFATDWKVPFTNNEAERSIRFSKVKQKVSGCFRTEDGAKVYMQIMSYISSCRKHGIGYFEAVRTALAGNALTLVSQWG